MDENLYIKTGPWYGLPPWFDPKTHYHSTVPPHDHKNALYQFMVFVWVPQGQEIPE